MHGAFLNGLATTCSIWLGGDMRSLREAGICHFCAGSTVDESHVFSKKSSVQNSSPKTPPSIAPKGPAITPPIMTAPPAYHAWVITPAEQIVNIAFVFTDKIENTFLNSGVQKTKQNPERNIDSQSGRGALSAWIFLFLKKRREKKKEKKQKER